MRVCLYLCGARCLFSFWSGAHITSSRAGEHISSIKPKRPRLYFINRRGVLLCAVPHAHTLPCCSRCIWLRKIFGCVSSFSYFVWIIVDCAQRSAFRWQKRNGSESARNTWITTPIITGAWDCSNARKSEQDLYLRALQVHALECSSKDHGKCAHCAYVATALACIMALGRQ